MNDVCHVCDKPGTDGNRLIFVQGQGYYHESCARGAGLVRSWRADRYASEGWRLKTMTSANLAGRVGFRGVEGVLLTFERRRVGSPGRRGR
jgi:Domain of unknown function (DUF4177)